MELGCAAHGSSLLGGNAGGELGVRSEGAARKHSYARETGLNEEVGRVKALHKLTRLTGPSSKSSK